MIVQVIIEYNNWIEANSALTFTLQMWERNPWPLPQENELLWNSKAIMIWRKLMTIHLMKKVNYCWRMISFKTMGMALKQNLIELPINIPILTIQANPGFSLWFLLFFLNVLTLYCYLFFTCNPEYFYLILLIKFLWLHYWQELDS